MEIEETQKECSPDMDICYGHLTMISANFTKNMEDSKIQIVPIYEARIEKGCGRKADFMKNVKMGTLAQFISHVHVVYIMIN